MYDKTHYNKKKKRKRKENDQLGIEHMFMKIEESFYNDTENK